MITVDLRTSNWDTIDHLFPRNIWQDQCVAFHGTSSVYETEIDANGLQWRPTIATRSDIEKVVEIYKTMGWCGISKGGFPVLEPWSLQSDFGNCESKPIFLGEIAERCMTFATRDFAGGETARALRYSLGDLEEFLRDPEARKRWRSTRWRNLVGGVAMKYPRWVRDVQPDHATDAQVAAVASMHRNVGVPYVKTPWMENLPWLASELERQADLIRRCRAPFEAHTHGVVYAMRFLPANLDNLKDRGCMGIASHVPIPSDQLVAKALISRDAMPMHLMRRIEGNGLVANIRSRRARM